MSRRRTINSLNKTFLTTSGQDTGQLTNNDLKAFERRLTEVVSSLQPPTYRWRIILTIISACTALSAWLWLADSLTYQVTFFQSLLNHPFFAISSLILLSLFLAGIHKRVVAPSIITSRVRQVLQDFNMSCDNTGKLILKPRPTSTST